MGLDLARALREMQRAQIVHCDIKPANMLLHQPYDEGRKPLKNRLLKLIDFGEANTKEGCVGYVAGTPGYMVRVLPGYYMWVPDLLF